MAGPCQAASCASHCAASDCAKCQPNSPTSGYQLEPGPGMCGRCMGLGAGPVATVGNSGGLTLTTRGGNGGRSLIYDFVCDKSGSPSAGPGPLVGPPGEIGTQYVITWSTPLAW